MHKRIEEALNQRMENDMFVKYGDGDVYADGYLDGERYPEGYLDGDRYVDGYRDLSE